MPNNLSNVAVLILAAGASSRLGHPKQLVRIGAQSLLERSAQVALDSGCGPVLVVLGAYTGRIRPVVQDLPLHLIENPDWESGMGSSIACGVQYLEKEFPPLEAIILMLCDQPLVAAETLLDLVKSWQQSGKGIVASEYGSAFGSPALFERRFIMELGALTGEKGAKSVMLAHRDELVLVPFPEGAVDLDTPEDLARWA